MRKTILLLITLLLLAIPARGWSAQKAQPPETIQPSPEIPGLQSVEGALSRVDSAQQSLWIKGPDGKEIEFKYSSRTQVTGGDNGVEGLTNGSSTHLKILYETVHGVNNAIKIDIMQA